MYVLAILDNIIFNKDININKIEALEIKLIQMDKYRLERLPTKWYTINLSEHLIYVIKTGKKFDMDLLRFKSIVVEVLDIEMQCLMHSN